MLTIETDRDRRAEAFFRAKIGPDYADRYGPQFQAWLNGRKPFPGNFARFLGIRIPLEALDSDPEDQIARSRDLRERVRQVSRTHGQPKLGPLPPPMPD
jgi:hypothetical protein